MIGWGPVALLTAALVWIAPAHAEDIAIVGSTLIDGTGAPALPDSVVVITGYCITAVGTVDTLSPPLARPSAASRASTSSPG
jgi:hypothetical protein